MIPIPRNATLVWPGVATGGGDEEAAAAAAATEEEEAAALALLVETSTLPRSSLSFRGLCARDKGLLSIERAECSVSEARQRVDEERTREDVEGGAVARSLVDGDLLLDLEGAAAGEAAAERSMVFSSAAAALEEGGGSPGAQGIPGALFVSLSRPLSLSRTGRGSLGWKGRQKVRVRKKKPPLFSLSEKEKPLFQRSSRQATTPPFHLLLAFTLLSCRKKTSSRLPQPIRSFPEPGRCVFALPLRPTGAFFFSSVAAH